MSLDISEIIRNYAQTLQAIATFVAVIIGGIWAYFRFYKQREHSLRPEFTVNIEFIGHQNNKWLIEVIALIENKGLVLHEIKDFTFDLRYLTKEDLLKDGEESINHQTNFHRRLKVGSWIPKDWINTMIEPGLKTRYSHVASVPDNATFLLLHGKFKYQDEKEFHTADKLLKVPNISEGISKE